MTTNTNDLLATDRPHGDVIGLLLAQHDQVRALLDRVSRGTGEARKEAFDELREMLARHETAEEMVLRPITRSVDGGDSVAEARMEEENHSKDVLAQLEKLDVTSAEFATTFDDFRSAVLAHAGAEEEQEFPLLRAQVEEKRLEQAEKPLELAEKTAPTHPHPSARSTTADYVAGPFAAMVDRARDALAKVTS